MTIVMDGILIIYSPHTGRYKKKTVERSWAERLFEIPWNPLASTKITVEFEPSIVAIDIPASRLSSQSKIFLAHTSLEHAINQLGIEEVLKNGNK